MKRILILIIVLALCSAAFAQGELHGFFVGATASLNDDGTAMTIKDNISPQVSPVIKLGESTYSLPSLRWKASNGWLSIDALSIFTKLVTFKHGQVFAGGSAAPVILSTANGVKREDAGELGIDLAGIIPLNQKAQSLYLAVGLKYLAKVDYQNTASDRVVNSIQLTAGIIGLNPLK